MAAERILRSSLNNWERIETDDLFREGNMCRDDITSFDDIDISSVVKSFCKILTINISDVWLVKEKLS